MRVEVVQAPPPERAEQAALHGSAQDRSDDRRGRDGAGRSRWRRTLAAMATARRAAEARTPNDPSTLGQGRPQRSLSLRLRQEIQALPRQIRLSADCRFSMKTTPGNPGVYFVSRCRFSRNAVARVPAATDGGTAARTFECSQMAARRSRPCGIGWAAAARVCVQPNRSGGDRS